MAIQSKVTELENTGSGGTRLLVWSLGTSKNENCLAKWITDFLDLEYLIIALVAEFLF